MVLRKKSWDRVHSRQLLSTRNCSLDGCLDVKRTTYCIGALGSGHMAMHRHLIFSTAASSMLLGADLCRHVVKVRQSLLKTDWRSTLAGLMDR